MKIKPSEPIRFTLPWPTSINAYWMPILRMPGKRPAIIISPEGRKYQRLAGQYLILQKLSGKRLSGPVAVSIVAHPKTKRKYDIDNLLKVTLDVLTYSGVWEDDSQVVDLRIVRGHPAEKAQISVTVRSCTAWYFGSKPNE